MAPSFIPLLQARNLWPFLDFFFFFALLQNGLGFTSKVYFKSTHFSTHCHCHHHHHSFIHQITLQGLWQWLLTSLLVPPPVPLWSIFTLHSAASIAFRFIIHSLKIFQEFPCLGLEDPDELIPPPDLCIPTGLSVLQPFRDSSSPATLSSNCMAGSPAFKPHFKWYFLIKTFKDCPLQVSISFQTSLFP